MSAPPGGCAAINPEHPTDRNVCPTGERIRTISVDAFYPGPQKLYFNVRASDNLIVSHTKEA
jgi:hypothetical protein